MKIVVITGSAYSLLNFRYELLHKMRDRGHEVTAFSSNEISGLLGKDELNIVKSHLSEIGIKLEVVSFSRSKSFFLNEVYAFADLYKKLRFANPDLIFAYTMKAVVFSMLAGKLLGIKNRIAWITGTGALFSVDSKLNNFTRIIGSLALKISLRLATLIVCQNEDNQKTIKKHINSLTPEVVVCIEGVNIKKFPYYPRISSEIVNVLFVGRLLIEKGILEFVEAAREVRKTNSNINFFVVGLIDSNSASLDQKRIDKIRNSGHIVFLGPSNNVLEHYINCDIFCLPSYHEGLPRTILEAMSVGRPVITTNAPGCKDTIIHEENGLVVPIKDYQALARSILHLAEDSLLRLRMGKTSRSIVEKKYSMQLNIENFCEMIGV